MAYPIHRSYKLLREAMSASKIVNIVNGLAYFKVRGIHATKCEVNKVWIRRSGDLEVEYILKLTGSDPGEKTPVTIGGTIYQDQKTGEERLMKLSSRVATNHSSPSDDTLRDFIAYIPELNLLLRTPAMDEEFIELSAPMNPKAMKPVLSSFLNDGDHDTEEVSECAIDILRYNRPGNRCTLRYRLLITNTRSGKTREWVLISKNYGKKSSARLELAKNGFQVMSYLSRNGFGQTCSDGIKVPRPVAYLDDLRMVLMENVPCPPVTKYLSSPHFGEHIRNAARALAKLHVCALRVTKVYQVEDEISAIKAAAAKTIQFSPRVASALESALSEIEASQMHLNSNEIVLLHGSFHSDHVLIGDDSVTILDFDNVCMGNPAIDLGRFLAHLRWLAVRNAWTEDKVREVSWGFIRSYRTSLTNECRDAIRFYLGASLLRMAYVKIRRPHFQESAASLVAAARRIDEWI